MMLIRKRPDKAGRYAKVVITLKGPGSGNTYWYEGKTGQEFLVDTITKRYGYYHVVDKEGNRLNRLITKSHCEVIETYDMISI